MRGWNSAEKEGSEFYNPDGYRIFVDKLRKELKKEIKIIEIDANIIDPEFTEVVIKTLDEIMKE